VIDPALQRTRCSSIRAITAIVIAGTSELLSNLKTESALGLKWTGWIHVQFEDRHGKYWYIRLAHGAQ